MPAQRGGPQQIPRPPSTRRGPPSPWPPLTRITTAQVVAAVATGWGDRGADDSLAESVDGFPLWQNGNPDQLPDLPLRSASENEAAATNAADTDAADTDAADTEALAPYAGREHPSAVLCVVFDEGDQAHVILTRRSSRLRSHTGEVSFPGGRLEPGESAVEAALREAEEEVGLDPGTVNAVGRLSALSTAVNPASITPIVATVAARPVLVANPDEVDRVFTVPLVELLAPGVHHSELWTWPDGLERTIHFFDLVGDTVWGATARMLSELLDWIGASCCSPR